mmetsp:Transcript_58569/g.143605  ORF Transcript_58569/g.143605 Transcript_58569/m.143605 type:complete len:405 (-) Transcript_58569:2-1216(-)
MDSLFGRSQECAKNRPQCSSGATAVIPSLAHSESSSLFLDPLRDPHSARLALLALLRHVIPSKRPVERDLVEGLVASLAVVEGRPIHGNDLAQQLEVPLLLASLGGCGRLDLALHLALDLPLELLVELAEGACGLLREGQRGLLLALGLRSRLELVLPREDGLAVDLLDVALLPPLLLVGPLLLLILLLGPRVHAAVVVLARLDDGRQAVRRALSPLVAEPRPPLLVDLIPDHLLLLLLLYPLLLGELLPPCERLRFGEGLLARQRRRWGGQVRHPPPLGRLRGELEEPVDDVLRRLPRALQHVPRVPQVHLAEGLLAEGSKPPEVKGHVLVDVAPVPRIALPLRTLLQQGQGAHGADARCLLPLAHCRPMARLHLSLPGAAGCLPRGRRHRQGCLVSVLNSST